MNIRLNKHLAVQRAKIGKPNCVGFKTIRSSLLRSFFFCLLSFGGGYYRYNQNTLNVWIPSLIYRLRRKTAHKVECQFCNWLKTWFLFILFMSCNRRNRRITNKSHQTPVITVLDSSGNPESGFVLGQSFWLGSIKGCEAVQKPHTLTLSNRFERVMHANLQKARAPFDIGYRVVYAAHTSPWQIKVEFLLDAAVSCWHDSLNSSQFILNKSFTCIIIFALFLQNTIGHSHRAFFILASVCRHRVATNKSPTCHKSTSIRTY